MPVRKANAVWEGNLKEGTGRSSWAAAPSRGSTRSAPASRRRTGTNPEELIGAAHAGCFSMALSAGLGRAGFTPTRVATSAKVHLEKVGEGFKITRIELDNESDGAGHRRRRPSRSRPARPRKGARSRRPWAASRSPSTPASPADRGRLLSAGTRRSPARACGGRAIMNHSLDRYFILDFSSAAPIPSAYSPRLTL